MKILVVGATGSIGHFVVEEAARQGSLFARWCERSPRLANSQLK
jgi:uncharacterized protein YbjT (DUF2867 family)